MKTKLPKILRFVAFFILLILILNAVSQPLVSVSSIDYNLIAGFYEEPEETLDAVYIGSSNCFVFWNSLFAWEEYGICVYPYASSSQPFYAAEYLIRECRKTQPDAVYVVNINTMINDVIAYQKMHWLLDYMPFSFNKLALTDYLCDVGDLTLEDRLEYYFHIIRYHDRWEDLLPADFQRAELWRKGASLYNPYLSKQQNISAAYLTTPETTALPDKLQACIDSLLDYCEAENLKVLFVTVPQARENLEEVKMYNTFNQMARERGFATLDLLHNIEELNLDTTQDFYNEEHTNIHGSLKFTHYLSRYLVQQFGLQDKRGDESYSAWQEAFTRYYRTTSLYALPFELDPHSRNYDLSVPDELSAVAKQGQVTVQWRPVDGAQGYAVFRKAPNVAWKQVTVTDQTSYTDTTCKAGTEYTYIVVPYTSGENKTLYGNFLNSGVKAKP